MFQEGPGSPVCSLSHCSYFSSELDLAGISYLHGLSSLAVAMAVAGTRCGVETPRPRLCRKQQWCMSKTADIIAGLLFVLGDKRKVVFSK